MVMDCLSFCLFQKVFIPPLFLKDSCAKYGILSWQLFSFNISNISFHSLLVCIASVEKSTNSLMGRVLLYVTFLFSLVVFKILFFFLIDFGQFNYDVSQCSLIGFNLCGSLRGSWIWMSISSPLLLKLYFLSHSLSLILLEMP